MRWSRRWVVDGQRLSCSDQAASRGKAHAESESTASREESRAGTRMTFLDGTGWSRGLPRERRGDGRAGAEEGAAAAGDWDMCAVDCRRGAGAR